jgi:CspA family cold shock protein
MERERGIVKWFDEAKNYGFITPDVGQHDIFFHRTDIDTIEQTIDKGMRVDFEVTKGTKGPEAKNVRPLEES